MKMVWPVRLQVAGLSTKFPPRRFQQLSNSSVKQGRNDEADQVHTHLTKLGYWLILSIHYISHTWLSLTYSKMAMKVEKRLNTLVKELVKGEKDYDNQAL